MVLQAKCFLGLMIAELGFEICNFSIGMVFFFYPMTHVHEGHWGIGKARTSQPPYFPLVLTLVME